MKGCLVLLRDPHSACMDHTAESGPPGLCGRRGRMLLSLSWKKGYEDG